MSFQIFAPLSISNQITINTVSSASEHTLSNKKLETDSTEFVSGVDNTKKIVFDLEGGATDSSLMLISSITENRIINFPDSSGTLITEDSTNTLSNKVLNSSNVVFAYNGGSRRLKFDISDNNNDTTLTLYSENSSNRTISFPDLNGTILTEAGEQYIFNKKLVSNSVFIVDDAEPTKAIQFDASSNTIGTSLSLLSQTTENRLIFFPDNDGTVALVTPKIQTIRRSNATQIIGTGVDVTANVYGIDVVTLGFTHNAGVFILGVDASYAGTYLLTASVNFSINATGISSAYFKINGAGTFGSNFSQNTATDGCAIVNTCVVVLAAESTIEYVLNQNTGGDLTAFGSAREISIVKL